VPPETRRVLKLIGAGAGVVACLVLLFRFKWLSGLLGGIVVAAMTAFSLTTTILPLLPLILPVAAGFVVLKVLWALFFDDEDSAEKKRKR